MKLNKSLIRAVLRGSRPPFASRRLGVGGRRLMLAMLTAAARPPKGTYFKRVTVAGVPVERVEPPHFATHGTLIYLHGGAYALGSAKGYRGMVAQLAAAAGRAIPRLRNAMTSASVSPPPAESPAMTVVFGSSPSSSNRE